MTVPDKATLNYIEKRIKAGFGQGQGEHYKPWIMVGDFPSLGTSSRICSHRFQREHHFLSQLEVSAYYLIDWRRDVVDIREQYPLLPIYDTILIADRMGVTHPRTNKPVSRLEVMTTDLLVTLKNPVTGALSYHAYCVKPAQDLSVKRTQEKIDIEAEYWRLKGVPLSILTEREVKNIVSENLKSLYPYFSYGYPPLDRLRLNTLFDEFCELLLARQNRTLSETAASFDVAHDLQSGTALAMFWHWGARKNIPLILDKGPLLPTRSITELVQIDKLKDILTTSEDITHERIAT